MALRICEHPAKRWNRFDQKFEPVFQNDRSVWDDDKLLGYCSTIDNMPLNLIVPRLSESEIGTIRDFVEQSLGVKVRVTSVSPVVPDDIMREAQGEEDDSDE